MDIRHLEMLENFSRFFDFLAEPGEYRKIIEEAKKAVAEFKDMQENQRKIKDIDKWRAEETKKFEVREAAVRDSEDSARKRVEEAMKKVSERELESIKLRADLQSEIAAVKEQKKQLRAVDTERKEVEVERARLQALQANLIEREVELNKKADALAAILGK